MSVPPRKTTLPDGLTPLIDPRKIERRLAQMAAEIQRAIPQSERPIAVVVLQGAFIFAADLLRQLASDYKIEVAFLHCRSYGSGTISSGRVLLLQDIEPDIDLRGRTVLLIDDILDTGLTMKFLVDHLRKRGASRVKLCVLLSRRLKASAVKIRADFSGFPVDSEFVVGYGLDFDGKFRHLAGLAALPAPQKASIKKPRGRAKK